MVVTDLRGWDTKAPGAPWKEMSYGERVQAERDGEDIGDVPAVSVAEAVERKHGQRPRERKVERI